MATKRDTHVIDAANQTLGRVSTQIADLLRGKKKVGFTFHEDHGDFVTVLNADLVKVTGKKADQKMYYRHSTYPGGLTEITYKDMMKQHPERIITLSVTGMLPNNRLRSNWLERLKVKTTKDNA